MRVTEDPGRVVNGQTRGCRCGIRFLYAPGTTIRSASFAARRLREAVGYGRVMFELVRMRSAGRLDCVVFPDSVLKWHPTQWMLRELLTIMGIPVAIQLDETPGPTCTMRTASRLQSHLRRVDGVVAISDWLAEWTRREAVRIAQPVEVLKIPIIVDVREHKPKPYPRDSRSVVYAASTDYGRDAMFIFRAMRMIWSERPGPRLVVTGMDPGRVDVLANVAGAADDLHEGRILALGYLPRDRLLAEYDKAAALLIPLHDDARSRARFPSKVGEYLAAARPVVTTDVGEVSTYLTDGETAFVASALDVGAFAAKISEVLSDPDRAARVGSAGRHVAEMSFDYALYGRPLRAFIDRLLPG